MFYVYILRCADDSFYVGSARDLDARVKAHNDGRGVAYTFRRRPVGLELHKMAKQKPLVCQRLGNISRAASPRECYPARLR